MEEEVNMPPQSRSGRNSDEHGNPIGTVYSLSFDGNRNEYFDFVPADSYEALVRVRDDLLGVIERLNAAASENRAHETRPTQQAALYNLIEAWNQLPTACKDECDGYSTFDTRGRAFFDAAIAVVKEAIK